VKTYVGDYARRPAPTPSKAVGRALAALGFGTQFALGAPCGAVVVSLAA
jgi:hypothetical protein